MLSPTEHHDIPTTLLGLPLGQYLELRNAAAAAGEPGLSDQVRQLRSFRLFVLMRDAFLKVGLPLTLLPLSWAYSPELKDV
jgi:hypothetical protein